MSGEVCGYCFGSGTIPAPSGLNDDFDQGQPCPECSPEEEDDDLCHSCSGCGLIYVHGHGFEYCHCRKPAEVEEKQP